MSSDTEMSIVRPDVLVMYGIALILDISGIILFLISLTILLAPIAIVLQWIVALAGNVLFSVWILFLRPSQSGSVRQSSAPSIKSQTQRISTKKKSSQKAGAMPTSPTPPISSAKGSASMSRPAFPAKGGHTSLKRWLKRVLPVWLIESIPLVGAISCSWIVAVYLEQKNG